MIPKTSKKLREAKFFLRRLRELDGAVPPNEEFDHNLSAFLSAARAVTFVLHFEAQPEYDEWKRHWEGSLTDEQKELCKQMVERRNVTQKQKGVPVAVEWEFVPEISFPGFFPIPGHVPEVGRPVHLIENTENGVVAECERYCDLLQEAVAGFLLIHKPEV